MAGVTHRLEAHVLGEGDWIGATEICRLCWLDLGAVMELAELGVVAPRGTPPGEWQIPATALPRPRAPRERSLTEPLAPVAQPLFFRGRVLAPEHPVTMRKAAEALDDRTVILGRARRRGEGSAQRLRRRGEQSPVAGERFILYFAALGVLQGHVEEHPLHRIERGVSA